MAKKSKVPDIDPFEDDDEFTPAASEFEITEEEKKNLKSLLVDVELDITDKFYAPICKKLIFYLEHGYKDPEVQGELGLSLVQVMQLRNKCPAGWWEQHTASSTKWLGRKRAKLLKDPNPNDLNIVQTLDPQWSPKKININLTPGDTAITAEEQKKIETLFPKGEEPTKVIEGEIIEKKE